MRNFLSMWWALVVCVLFLPCMNVVAQDGPGLLDDMDMPADEKAPADQAEAPEPEVEKPKKLEKANKLTEQQLLDGKIFVPIAHFNKAQNASLELGILALLRACGDASTNPSGFPFKPKDTRKIIATVDVEVRYREEKRKQAVYKTEYEEYEVMVPVKDGSEVKLVKKTRKRVVSRVKTGEKTVTVLVRDDNGPIVRTRQRHEYGTGDKQELPKGFMGVNAMALYTLNMAGLQPGDSEQQRNLYSALVDYTKAYGLPDETFELAWLTMAFATYPGNADERLLNFMITKLMLGQRMDGDGEGLWGPYCFHAESHIRLTQNLQQLQQIHEKAKEITERRNTARNRKKLGEIEARVDRMNQWILHLGRHALRTDRYERDLNVPDFEGQLGFEVNVAGLLISIHQERIVSLESTALVLQALQVANDYGYLPREFGIEAKDVRNRDIFKKQPTQQALRKALGAVLKLREKDGQFDQGHLWERDATYDRANMGVIRVQDVELPSRVTLNSSLSGYQALASLQSLLGRKFFTPNAVKAMEEVRGLNMKALSLPALTLKGDKWTFRDFGYDNPEDGGLVRVWSNVLASSAFYRSGGYPIARDADAFRRQILRVMNAQQHNGLWTVVEHSTPITSSVMWEYAKIRRERLNKERAKKGNKKQNNKKVKPSQYFPSDWSQNARILGSLMAMQSMMTQWRPPLAVLADLPDDEQFMPLLQKTRRVINAEQTIPSNFQILKVSAGTGNINHDKPLLIDMAQLTADRAKALLPHMEALLKENGCVVLIGEAEAEVFVILDEAFQSWGYEKVEADQNDSRIGAVLGQMKAKTPAWVKSGQAGAYQFKRGGSAIRGLFKPEEIAELMGNIILRYLKLEDLNLPDDPMSEDAMFVANEQWVQKLNALNASIKPE